MHEDPVPGRVELRWAAEGQPIEEALALRLEVFCEEQGVSREEELDGRDAEALHLLARAGEGGPVVGTLRLLDDGRTAKIGRVAVARAWRRRGIALAMLELALAAAQGRGCSRARLAAQVEAIELYRRTGFEVESEPFMDAGIEHVWMGRELVPAAGAHPPRADDGSVRPSGARDVDGARRPDRRAQRRQERL